MRPDECQAEGEGIPLAPPKAVAFPTF